MPPTLPKPLKAIQRGSSLALLMGLFCLGGCTSFSDYIHNGFKVGPNYQKPPAPVADEWIDSKASAVNSAARDPRDWWKALNDPKLDELIETAYRQNLTLRSAGTRILAARAQRGIAVGYLFPQTQQATAAYTRNQLSNNVANPAQQTILGFTLNNRTYNDTAVGANLSWEIDFWGRYRRGVEQATAELDASIENYDDALVLLIAEVASSYVQIRVIQQQLRYVDDNIVAQKFFVDQAEGRLKGGAGRLIDQAQMRSNLRDTLALREQFETALRQTNDALCVLLGIPPRDLLPRLGSGDIPTAPPQVVIGIPADLLRRRPDLRKAERLVAAQSARIGIATSDLYPHFSLIGGLGYEAANFPQLFGPQSFYGTVGPSVRWDILNYGRLLNGIRVQDALFQTSAVDYQNAVLNAGREVEDALVLFLRAQTRTRQLTESAKEAKIAVDEAQKLSKDLKFDLNTAFVTANFLVGQQDKLAQAQGDIALGFIQVYKALGGGWEIRLPAPVPPPAELPPPRKDEPVRIRFLTPQAARDIGAESAALPAPRAGADREQGYAR